MLFSFSLKGWGAEALDICIYIFSLKSSFVLNVMKRIL